MDWSAILYAALGGGIGGALGPLIGQFINKEDAKKGTVTVLSAVFIAIGYQGTTLLYKNMTLPRIIPLDTLGMVQAVPALKYIQAENPDLYADMVYPIDKAVRNNEITRQTLDDFRRNFHIALADKRKNASADMIRAENETAIELYKILKVKSPVVCTQKLHGRTFNDLTQYLTTAYSDQEQKVLADFFIAESRNDDVVVDVNAGKVIWDEIFKDTLSSLGITNLEPQENKINEHKKICDLHIIGNTELNNLTDKDFFDVYGYFNAK